MLIAGAAMVLAATALLPWLVGFGIVVSAACLLTLDLGLPGGGGLANAECPEPLLCRGLANAVTD